jgi:integrase/recombinase XerD
MVRDSPRRDYNTKRERLTEIHTNGEITTEDYNRITDFLDYYDELELHDGPEDGSTKEPSTLRAYCAKLRLVAKRLDTPLVEADVKTINDHMTVLMKGISPHQEDQYSFSIKDDGFSKNTVMQYQSALRKFYEHHDGLGIEKTDITLVQPKKTKVDEDEMFTDDEIRRLREACPNLRDRCLLELLLFTGQRIRAIQTLRIKDVDVDNGTFTLNPNVEGLKYAEGKRPLLGARAFVKKWLEYHPTGDDEDFLLTVLTENHSEAGSMLHRRQLSERLSKMGNDAGIDKPTNPHQFRHYFVTIAKKRYGLDNDDIKWIIGHAPDSRVMETTYQHLTDEDRINSIEVQAGIASDEEEKPLKLDDCPTCGRDLPVKAKQCYFCGEQVDLDDEMTKQTIEDMQREDMVEQQDQQKREAADELAEFLKNNRDVWSAIREEVDGD